MTQPLRDRRQPTPGAKKDGINDFVRPDDFAAQPTAVEMNLLSTAGMRYAEGLPGRPVIERFYDESRASSGSQISHLLQCNSPDTATVDAAAPPQVVPRSPRS